MDTRDSEETPVTTTPVEVNSSKKRTRRKHKSKAPAKINPTTGDGLPASIVKQEAGSPSSSFIGLTGSERPSSGGSSLLQTSQIVNTSSKNSLNTDTLSRSASTSRAENVVPVDRDNKSTTSKYFGTPPSLPPAAPLSSTTIDSKSRGKKRQRMNSEGSSVPSNAEMSKDPAEGKKKRDRKESPQMAGSGTVENEVRQMAKLRKKGKTGPINEQDGSESKHSPNASGSLDPDLAYQSIHTDAQPAKPNGKPINTTASQLADRARTMKDREELARLRLDQQSLDEKLAANQNRMEELEAELGEVKREREGLKEQSRKEIGFKDEVIKSQDKLVDDLKQSLTCNVCLGMFDDPHTIAPCGHTSCAPCLLKWFESPNSLAHPDGATREGGSMEGRRRACGTCRTSVLAKPMPAFVLNDLILSLKPRLRTSGETGTVDAEAMTDAEAALTAPARDRNTMWDHIFGAGSLDSLAKGYFVDEDDGGIARCRECGSEIYHDECTGCGAVFSDAPLGHLHDEDMSDFDMSDEAEPARIRPHAFGDLGGPRWLEAVAARGWDVDSGSDDEAGSEMDDFIVSDGPVDEPRRVRGRLVLSDSDGDDDGDDDDVRIVSPVLRRHRPTIEISDDEEDDQADEGTPPRYPRRTGGRGRSQVIVDSDSDVEPIPYILRHGVAPRIAPPLAYPYGTTGYPQPNADGVWSDGEEGPAYSDAGGSMSHYGNGYDRDSDPEQGGWSGGSEGHISVDGSEDYGDDED